MFSLSQVQIMTFWNGISPFFFTFQGHRRGLASRIAAGHETEFDLFNGNVSNVRSSSNVTIDSFAHTIVICMPSE